MTASSVATAVFLLFTLSLSMEIPEAFFPMQRRHASAGSVNQTHKSCIRPVSIDTRRPGWKSQLHKKQSPLLWAQRSSFFSSLPRSRSVNSAELLECLWKVVLSYGKVARNDLLLLSAWWWSLTFPHSPFNLNISFLPQKNLNNPTGTVTASCRQGD